MILRVLAMSGGLAGAAGLSQYPEFSQQYTQNLSGQVEALSTVVADFDASAARSDLSRDDALAQMTGTQFLTDRRADMTRTFTRFETLSGHYDTLAAASPMQRILMPHRMGDGETLRGTWANYAPAMPLTAAGALSAVAGFFGGWLLIGGVFGFLTRLFRRKPKDAMPELAPFPPVRVSEPPLTRGEPKD